MGLRVNSESQLLEIQTLLLLAEDVRYLLFNDATANVDDYLDLDFQGHDF